MLRHGLAEQLLHPPDVAAPDGLAAHETLQVLDLPSDQLLHLGGRLSARQGQRRFGLLRVLFDLQRNPEDQQKREREERSGTKGQELALDRPAKARHARYPARVMRSIRRRISSASKGLLRLRAPARSRK